MSTTLHSFMDIFETTIEDGDTSVQLNKIVIPLIQRDYAQGRIDKDINRVRSRFLQALYRAVTGDPITLDFVYGDIDEEGTMTPLDGQQRLTTLFLLHWYAAKKEKISEDKYALVELLKSKESFDDGILDGIISAFLAQCEKDNLYPWNYYYVKYPVFRPGSYGKMSNDDVVNKPYMFSVMQTKTQWSQNTYMPYLKEADDDHLSRDEMGQYLVYDDVYIVCENNSYGVYRNDDDSLTDTVTISQNEAGIDTEDRIIKLKKYIANMK